MTRRLKQEHLKMIRVEASKDEDALGDEEEGEGTDDPAAAQLRIRRPRHSGISKIPSFVHGRALGQINANYPQYWA